MSIQYTLNPEFQDFKDDLFHIQDHFNASDQSIHKARNELRIASINAIQTVIKAFKIPHLLNRIVYAYFRDSKAKKSYLNAIELLKRGVNTPQPIGYIEFYQYGVLANSYFLSIYEPYDFTIREALHHTIDDHQEVLKQFTAFTYNLHQKGVWHVDYSPGNILIRKEESSYRFMLVDINRMEFKSLTGYSGLENFNKLWAQEADLELIATHYANLSGLDPKQAIKIIKKHDQKLRKYIAFKRKLKGK